MNNENRLNKNTLIAFGIILIIIGIIFIKRRFYSVHTKNKFNIGILQTASHPALDQARAGFINRMNEALANQVNFVLQNADGSSYQAQLIAQSMVSNSSFNGFFAIATPALQVLADTEKSRPIFMAAVSDPKALGVLGKDSNVCGSSDMIDIDSQVEMLHQLLPDAKVVAILYNTSEINSKTLAQKMKVALKNLGTTPLEFGFSSAVEVGAAVNSACSKADAIIAPTDNSIASSIQTIVQISQKYKKPLIVSDNLLVRQGALAAMGVNYYESGKQAADIAIKVLTKGLKPSQIPLAKPKIEKVVINKKVLDGLGLKLPTNFINQVEFVE